MTKHFQSMTQAALSAACDDSYTTSTEDGDLTTYFSASGEWVLPDSGPSYWEHDYAIIGVVLDGYDGVTTVFTEDEAVDRFGLQMMRHVTECAIEVAA